MSHEAQSKVQTVSLTRHRRSRRWASRGSQRIFVQREMHRRRSREGGAACPPHHSIIASRTRGLVSTRSCNIPDSERSLGNVYTKNEQLLVDSEPNKSRKVPAPGLPREPKYVENFEQQQHSHLEQRRLQQERKAEIMQTGRSFAPAISSYNRFPNHRPCIHPVRPNIVQDTDRAQRSAYTKNENILVDSVPSSTPGQPSKNSISTYTKTKTFR